MTINRRSFLKASALTVAGTMITPDVINSQRRSAANGQRVFKAQDPKVRELLARMTLEEKIGQMIQTERGALKDISDVEKLLHRFVPERRHFRSQERQHC